uniref:Ig-like domain-containing protein n=1 Tax=Gadus morhua TaxID=8049 RepID=A0A8C5CV07_GADMO
SNWAPLSAMQLVMLVVLFVGFTGEFCFRTPVVLRHGPPVQALQGDGVTLSCNYSSATYFFWYRQYPSSPPQFLIKEYMELSGFTLKKDSERKVFALEISSAAVTDSALYYCAVRFRFPRPVLLELCAELRPALERHTARSQGLSVPTQVLTTLGFLATGAFQRELADRSGVCQSTLSRAMPAVWD